MKIVLKQILTTTFIYLILCSAMFLMLKTIIGYASFDTTYAFLAKKQDYLDNKFWLFCFYTHVFTSLFAFIAGFTQFSKYILKHHKKLHRVIGKIYVIAILFVNFPAGFVMAIYANGLLSSKIAFMILDSLWFYFTLNGWRFAMRKNFKEHRKWMIRSYALTFSAITLRTWKLILTPFISDPLTVYMIDAWMGFVPNLIVVEIFLRYKSAKTLTLKSKRKKYIIQEETYN